MLTSSYSTSYFGGNDKKKSLKEPVMPKTNDTEGNPVSFLHNSRSVISDERKRNPRKLRKETTADFTKEGISTRMLQLKRASVGQAPMAKKPLAKKRPSNALISKIAHVKHLEQNKSNSRLETRYLSDSKAASKPVGYLMNLLTPKHRASLEHNLMEYLAGSVTPPGKKTEPERTSASSCRSLDSHECDNKLVEIDKKIKQTLEKFENIVKQHGRVEAEKRKRMAALSRENGLLKEKIRLLERKLG